jgi:molybdopterin molybdotransferase
MDGYACRSSDLEGDETVLSISDRILAGRAPAPLQPGTAARIMTGAVVPEGADMVVVQERCEADGERVRIRAGAEPGANIRRAGEELAPGQVVLGAGRRLSPEDLGLLATIGLGEVMVRPRLRVFVLASGDELVEPGRPLAPGQIYNANAVMLAALVRTLGCEPVVADRVSDTPEATEAALRSAVEQADLVLTSGGVSVGDADWVRKTIERLGRLEVWKVAVKPGKPLAFGLVDGVPILGLPGNPVASHVGFCLFAAPMIRAMLGIEEAFPAPERRPSAFECAAGSREVYWRVRPVDGALHPFPHQGSAALSSLSWATGLARVPADRPVSAGEPLDYFPFSALLA